VTINIYIYILYICPVVRNILATYSTSLEQC
jgi:hypothetical protein